MSTHQNVIIQFGWEPGYDRVFYIITSDGNKHVIPEEVRIEHSNLIDLDLPYVFSDDADGNAIGLVRH